METEETKEINQAKLNLAKVVREGLAKNKNYLDLIG